MIDYHRLFGTMSSLLDYRNRKSAFRLIITGTVLLTSIIDVIPQDTTMFVFTKTESGRYLVTPRLNKAKGEGNRGIPIIRDQYYTTSLLYNPIREVISKEKAEKLDRSSLFLITFNKEGEIINCIFFLHPNDISLITEKDLYNIYQGLMKQKIDTNKVKIGSGPDPTSVKEFDYTEMGGSLIPPEYRKK